MECESVPVGHPWQAERQAGEDGDPNHLLEDTYRQAQRQDTRRQAEKARFLDVVSQEPPEYPEDGSQEEVVHAPGCHQEPERDGNVAVPRVQADPLLQGEQQAQ